MRTRRHSRRRRSRRTRVRSRSRRRRRSRSRSRRMKRARRRRKKRGGKIIDEDAILLANEAIMNPYIGSALDDVGPIIMAEPGNDLLFALPMPLTRQQRLFGPSVERRVLLKLPGTPVLPSAGVDVARSLRTRTRSKKKRGGGGTRKKLEFSRPSLAPRAFRETDQALFMRVRPAL